MNHGPMEPKASVLPMSYADPCLLNLFQNDATYDWEFYIKERNKGDLKQYVERINIELHETFDNPKRGNFSQGWAYSWVLESSLLFLFYYLAPLQNDALVTSRGVQFIFGDKREVYLLDESALPVTEKESMREGKGSTSLIFMHKQGLHFSSRSLTFYFLFSVLKEPPFVVREQGYAGFTIFADVVLKDGKMVNLLTKVFKYSNVPNGWCPVNGHLYTVF